MLGTRSGLIRILAGCVGGSLIIAGCSNADHTITAPNNNLQACSSGSVLQLAVLQASTVACTTGTAVTLQGAGASYLVVPQFATGSAPNTLTAYKIGVGAGATASIVSGTGPSLALAPPGSGWSLPRSAALQSRQRAFDAQLMNDARRHMENGDWRPSRVLSPGGIRTSTVPQLNSVQQFQVLSSESPVRFTRVGARLVYIGANVLIYIDTLAPANGFTSNQLQAFGQIFDQTLYPIDTAAFGQPTDIDQNGHLIMLLSPVVNALTPANECATQGFVGGFFVGGDLGITDTTSNRGEIFYSLVPDPNGTVSCAHSVAELEETTGSTFLHELQHLINFGQHVLVHHGSPERGWLDEGLSIVAEELGSLHYENKYPPPTGRSNPAQLFPDSSQGYINGLLFDSYAYLLKTDTATVTLHSDADNGLAWRGGDWLLARWLGDQKGTGIYRRLVQTSLTGTSNIANAAGESFDGLFGDFSLALYTDSLPGIPKASIPTRNKFAFRNLRRMYQRLYDTSQPSGMVPRPFPILTPQLSGTISASMVPGTMSFYRLDTSSGQSTVTIQFSAADGTPLSAILHPQVSIFRLPPGT